MDIVGLIVSLMSGAAGGNAAGAIFKKISLGPVGNSIAGIIGGGAGGAILRALGVGVTQGSGASGLDIASVVGNLLSGGLGAGC